MATKPTIYDALNNLIKQRPGTIELLMSRLNDEEKEVFYNFVEEIYELGVTKENEYWREYGARK